MTKIIFDLLIKRITNKNTKLLISSLTYYSIISLIPTLLLTTLILDFFHLQINMDLTVIFNYIGGSFWSNFIIVFFSIYLISRIFFVILKDRFSLPKSLIFSIAGSLLLIIFLVSFISSYLIENFYLENIIKLLLLFTLLFLIIFMVSKSNLKYSLIFSSAFSLVSLILFYGFFYAATFFINYENYYGILAPIFLIILAINLFINLIYITYIGAEEFTKISNIRFIKR